MADNDLSRIQGGEGAKFNSSLADLERIHTLLMSANQSSIIGDFYTWLGSLQAIDREISTYLSEKEDKELDTKRVREITTNKGARTIVVRKLTAYERELRMLRSKKKLGIVAQDDASTAALN